MVYIGLEDHPEDLQRNFHWMMRREMERMRNESASPEAIDRFTESVLKNLTLRSAVGRELYLVEMVMGQVSQGRAVTALIEKLPRPLTLLILDPMSRMNPANENDNTVTTALVNAAERIGREVQCPILIPHHVGKLATKDRDESLNAGRGGSGFGAAARSNIRLMVIDPKDPEVKRFTNCPPEVIAEGDLLRLTHNKVSQGKRGGAVYLRRQGSDFELFEPVREAGQEGQLMLAIQELYEWWVVKRNREPFYAKDVETLRESIFLRGKLSRDQVRAVLTHGDTILKAITETGVKKPHSSASSLTFKEDFEPDPV